MLRLSQPDTTFLGKADRPMIRPTEHGSLPSPPTRRPRRASRLPRRRSAAGCALTLVGVLAGAASAQPGVRGDRSADFDSMSRSMAQLEAMSRFQTFGGIKCVTRPSRDAVLGFSLPTTLKEIAVRGGERVTEGQLLVRGDDEEDLALLETQRIRAETDLPVERAVGQAELAAVEWERAQEAFSKSGINQLEYDRARLAASTAQIDVGIAKNTLAQDRAQVVRFEARVRRLRLTAPFDGIVDNVLVDVGQSVSEADSVVRVVNIDPLWIDVPAPTSQTIQLGLQVGGEAWVAMDLPGEARVFPARIVEVSPVADAASGTRRVRVEMPNPDEIVAGVTSYVRFTEPTTEWKERLAVSMAEPRPGARPPTAGPEEETQR